MKEEKELLKEIEKQVVYILENRTNTELRNLYDLNHKVRKVVSELLLIAEKDEELIDKILGLYLELGDNYSTLFIDPVEGLKFLRRSIPELADLIDEVEMKTQKS